jgi:hypothetical protein
MTANDELMDEAIQLGLTIDRLAINSTGRVLEKLNALSDELAVLIIRTDPTAVVRESTRRARLETLVEEMDRAIQDAYRQIGSQVSADLDNASALTQDSLSKLLALLLLIKGLSRQLDKPALVSLRKDTFVSGASISDWWDRQAEDMRFRTRRALEDALRLTQIGKEPGTGDLVGAIKDTSPGSLFSAAPRHAQGLIRSAYHAVANRVRVEMTLRHPELFRAFQHISVLDGKTSGICRARAGKLWTLEGAPIGHTLPFARPALHWNCRSHLIAVMHAYSNMPARIQRRIRKEDFDGRSSPEPDIEMWLEIRGEERDPGPLDYQTARQLLGL